MSAMMVSVMLPMMQVLSEPIVMRFAMVLGVSFFVGYSFR
jgi:hypothetical protein